MSYAKYAGGGHEEETPQESYYEGEGGGYEGGGYDLPPEYYEQPEETGRAWNVHYSPTWFVEEQENRLNPDYQSEAPEDMSGEMIDAVANYVKGWQQQNPTEWRYGDPGWDRTGDLWRETIKPLEQQYQEEQEALQRQQAQEQAQQQQMSQPPVQGGQIDPNAPQGEAPGQIEQQQELQPPQQQRPRQYNYDPGQFSMVQEGDFNGRKIGNMYAGPPPASDMEQAEQMINSDPKYSGLRIDQSGANYENLTSFDAKLNYLGLPSTNGTDVENAPAYARFTQPFVTSIMSSSGTGHLAEFLTALVGGPAAKVGFATSAATFGYNYARQQNWIQGNKYLDKIIELTDWLDDKGAQAQGALAYGWEKAGGDDITKGGITDIGSLINNWKFFFDNFDTIMYHAFGEGRASKEFDPKVVGIVGKLVPNMGANFLGGGHTASRLARNVLSQVFNPGSEWIDRGETTRNNMGLDGVYKIPEEMMGSDALLYWYRFGQDLLDRGITDEDTLEYIIGHYVNQVYGDLSNYSEFLEHEMGDLGNFVETIQPRVIQVAGNITHDANLAQAAKNVQGNFAFDMLGQLPAGQQIQNAVQTVAKAFGKNINASGGIDEVLTEWNNLNMTSNVEDLTWRDRNLSGITEDGKLKSFTPNVDPHTVKNPLVRNFERIKNFFSTTNEWKATMSGDAMFEYINLAMDDILEQHPDETAEQTEARLMQFVDELENPDTISENSPFAKSSQSVLFNTIKYDLADAVKNHKAEITKAISDYSKLNNNRQVLNTLAEALGLNPSEVMQKYDKEKTVLTQMIVNKADENGGTIPGIVDANGQPIAVESKAFGDRVISMLKPFSGDEGKAYDPRLLSMQLTSQIADGITTTLTTKYNIKPEKWVYRFGDMVKKMQHLWLLGLSPSYLANNLVNNVVTRTALGYGGWLSPKAISDWNERFGFQPERFAESTAAEMLGTTQGDSKTGHQKLMEAIKERKEKKDIFSFVNKGSSWASEHLGFFGKISGKIEENESKQIMASAMMSYHARTWKPGVNFRKMPAQLENAIRAENPAILDAIYAAISAGANMKEIENAIYGTFIIPSVRDTLVQAAQNIGIADSEEAVYSFFDQGGMMSALNKALQGKRGEEILNVVNDFISRVKAISLINLSEDFSKRAESIGNLTANEAFAEAIKLGHEISDDMTKVWLESMDANDVLFSRRIRENIPSSEFRAMFVAQQKALNERWNNVYAKVEQTYGGIVKGLGMSTKTQEQYNAAVLAKNNIWRTFYTKTQPEAIQPYLDALVWQTGDTFETWDSRVRKAWADYTKDIKDKYKKATEREQKAQERIDAIFAQGLKQGLGNVNGAKVDEIIVPLQQQIRDIRQEIIELTKQTRGKADNNPSLNVKDMAWKADHADREELVKRYYELQAQLYDEIDKLGPQTSAQESDIHRDDQSHADNINSDRVERKAAEDQKVYEEFTNTVTEKVAEAEDPETVLNDVKEVMEEVREDNPTAGPKEVMEQYLNRNNLRDVAKMAGATDAQADAYARLMDAQAKAWERQHPGKDYFRDELKMRVSRIDENRTVEIEGADGNLYQIDSVDRADINTPEFEAWHGNNPENFNSDGTPLTVWHGSKKLFTAFDTNKLGSNTRAQSAKKGFFFAGKKETSMSSSYSMPFKSRKDIILRAIDREVNDPINRGRFDFYIYPYEFEGQNRRFATNITLDDVMNQYDEAYEAIKSLPDEFPEFANSVYQKSYEAALEMFGKLVEKYMEEEKQFHYERKSVTEWGLDKRMYEVSDVAYAILRNIGPLHSMASSINYLIRNKDDFTSKFDILYEIPDPNPYTREFYLSFNNPFIYDYKGEHYRDVSYATLIQQAIDGGYDAVILKNTYDGGPQDNIYVVFNEDQMKSVYNSGEFSKGTNNFYHQEQQQRIKGEFRVEDGEKLVELFRGSDLSTLIHETAGHGFASTLNDSQKEALAAYNGWTYAKYRHLEEAFYYYPDTLTTEERQAWIDSQEKFAYGFEQYLMEGKAPNSKMAAVFEAFKQYLLDIYKGLKNLIYKGEPINIHEVKNGVSLAQIFDSMLSEQPTRFSIDRSNLTGLQGESITLDNHRATDSFMRNRNREYFQAESDKQLEKFNAIKTAAENKLKNSVADYVQDIENEYKLSIDESMELVVEIMHGFGLNQDLQENEAMKNLIDSKTGNQRQQLVNEFVTKSENREAAVNISDEAVEKFMQDIHDDPEHFDQWKALYAYEQTNENDQAAKEARLTNQTARFMNGKYVPLDDVDIKILPGAGKKDDAIFRLAKRLYEEEQRDPAYSNIREAHHFLLEDYYDFIAGTVDENGKPVQSKQTRDRIAENIQKYNFSFDDPNHTNAMDEINAIRNNMPTRETPPVNGTYVVQTYNFTHGEHEIVGAVYHDGALVAYIPKDMKVDRITSEGSDENVRRIGVSPQDPSLWVYMDETGVHTEPNRKTEAPKNPYKPEMEKNSMPDIDPVAQINDEVSYDQIINMLQEFGRLYKTRVDDASNTTKFGNLDSNTRQMLKDYIENDVRQDMMNAKFRTGKFGEMMRDAALLNYSKRYGFDNFLTLLCPYQFWNTRSMWNWFQRMSGKGGRLWRKYARLKDIERRNLKEIMPSRMTGKIGIPIPGMPDWMGGGLFMPTNQLNIIGNFMDPIYETFGDKNAIIATAERFCQEALDEGRISYEQWLAANDPAKRNSSPIWQEMYAKAQQEASAEPDMGSLFKQYFGMPLPITIGKAVLSGQPGDWNQTPMTRTGTAWRAIFGDNVVGKAGQFALSLPERIIRDAVVKATGNNDFEYKEFGYFGDYYIRQQVWDMVVEGRIDPKDAIEAVIAKDGNAIWDEAAQRQRMEVLQKTQVLSAMAPVKKMAEDIANGKTAGEALKEDYAYVLSGAVSALFPTTIVRDAEMTWRGQKAEMADLYAANDKEGQKRFHEANPNYTYNNLRYEDDPEVSLRKYLYKSITDVWFDLDKASQAQLKMTFGNDFMRDVINPDTRAIEAMDINRLWAYAQAMHGKTPYLATDKLKTAGVTNPPAIQPVQIPRAEKVGYNVYISERERLWPGMADVENIYYNLPPEDRKMFRNVNPNLGKYWDWKRQYKDEHPEVESFSKRQSQYNNIAEAEDFCAMADPLVLGAITRSAYTGKKPDKDYEYLIRQGMASVGSTKSYDDFLENVYNYILGK